MRDNELKEFYRQRLPHIQPIGATFFVTFRLYGSIPKVKLKELTEKYENLIWLIKQNLKGNDKKEKILQLRKQYFMEFEKLLENINQGPTFCKVKEVAEIIKKQLKRFDGKLYDLLAFTIMSNHVHILIDTSIQIPDEVETIDLFENYYNLDKILKRIKGATSRYANQFLNRKGQFWERESFDIYIRNEKMHDRVINYILNNPVKANLVSDWKKYEWNYLKHAP